MPILRKAEKDHYESLVQQNKGNLRKSWQIIKLVLNKTKTNSVPQSFNINGKTITNPLTISNHFNSFFSNVGPSLSRNIPHIPGSPTELIKPIPNNTKFSLTHITENDIVDIILNLKNSIAGFDVSPLPHQGRFLSNYLIKSSLILCFIQRCLPWNLPVRLLSWRWFMHSNLRWGRIFPLQCTFIQERDSNCYLPWRNKELVESRLLLPCLRAWRCSIRSMVQSMLWLLSTWQA